MLSCDVQMDGWSLFLYLSHTPSPYLSLSHAHSLLPSTFLSFSLSLTHTHSPSLLPLPFSLSLSLTNSQTYTLSPSLSIYLSFFPPSSSLSLFPFLSFSFSISHKQTPTHTHAHVFFLSSPTFVSLFHLWCVTRERKMANASTFFIELLLLRFLVKCQNYSFSCSLNFFISRFLYFPLPVFLSPLWSF